MSEHFPLRSSVGSGGSALPSHHYHDDPDPLASVWIRRLHLTPDPPPPPPATRHAVSTRSTGFGPLRWSPRPLRDEPGGAWDAGPGPVPGGGGGGVPPRLSPFFRFPPPAAEIGDFAPVRPTVGFGSIRGWFPGLPSRPVVGGDRHDAWLPTRAAGSTYPSHAVDMVPIRTSHDLHVRQDTMIPQNFARGAPPSSSMIPQNFARHDPSSSSMIPQNFARHDPILSSSMVPQNFARHDPSSSSMIAQNFARHASSRQDEPFSYWNMGRFQRSTTTSSISQIAAAPGNFIRKRSADSSSFLPLKFRKLGGPG